jgi:hypothetical protein
MPPSITSATRIIEIDFFTYVDSLIFTCPTSRIISIPAHHS